MGANGICAPTASRSFESSVLQFKAVYKQTSLDHFSPQLAVINKNTCVTALQKQLEIVLPRGGICSINTIHPLFVHETVRVSSSQWSAIPFSPCCDTQDSVYHLLFSLPAHPCTCINTSLGCEHAKTWVAVSQLLPAMMWHPYRHSSHPCVGMQHSSKKEGMCRPCPARCSTKDVCGMR